MTDVGSARAAFSIGIAPALRCGAMASIGILFALAGCSSNEDALRKEVADLRYDVDQARQHNHDLKRRMQLAEARNRVLIDLVKGLTADPGAAPSSGAGLGRAHESLAALDRDLDALASTLQKSRNDFAALRSQRAALQDELGRATRTIEQARAEEAAANERVSAFEQMLLQVKAMMAAGNLKVRVQDNRMLLELPETLLFERGKAVLKKHGRQLLDEVAKALITVGDREFQIAGHAASGRADKGSYESDWHLSAARAVHVTQYLVSRGVPKTRLSAAAHADTRPLLAPDGSLDDEWKNRRIEIVLMPRLDELPDLSRLDALLAEHGDTTAAPDAATEATVPTGETPAPAPAATTPAAPAAASEAPAAPTRQPATE
jgi:chemotaxis protein MotB